MRYDDASQPESAGHETVARPDIDSLPAGSFGPATGNAITGQGTSTGSSGADSVAAGPATIVAVQGAGGQAVAANGAFQASGQFGLLSMDAQGNFSYVRNAGTPDGVQDVFNYTLADASGANASSTLTIDIAQVAAAAAGQGVVALPAGVEMSDIHVNGRDLVITMPDGSQMVIPNGAVFVPEITIGDVQVPPTNLAALLVDSEPQPSAGLPPSSGNNFNDPVPPLDPGVPLGDLIPPTELGHTPPVFQEPAQGIDTEPTVIIETPDFPAGAVNASESVNEKGLPGRDGNLPNEPAGSGEIADGNGANNSDGTESNTGTIVFTAEDGLDSITINGAEVTAVGQEIAGDFGTLTITGIDLANGQITYSYTLGDNTSGDSTADVFDIVVTDDDGDQAAGTLTVNIIDDVPTARNDTDSTDLVTHIATGNVMTGADTTSGAAGADTVGADNATLTAVSSNNTSNSDSSFDSNGNLVVEGEFGTLTIKADGSYSYTASASAPGGSSEVFTYTLTDGDGDTTQATLTITNPDRQPTVGENDLVQLDDDALAGGNAGGPGDDPDSLNATGTLSGSGGDGALTFALTEDGAPDGFSYQLQDNGDLWVMQGDTHVLTISVDADSGQYSVTQVAPIDHPEGDAENNVDFDISYTVTDSDGDVVTGHLPINVDDDTPVANNDTDTVGADESTAAGNVITGANTTSGGSGADHYGADGPGSLIAVSSNGTGQSDNTFDGSGNLVVHGDFGTLTIDANGEYTYLRDQGSPDNVKDVFTYTIVDADGDTTTATLTITVPDFNEPPTAGESSVNVSEEGLIPDGDPDNNGTPDTTNDASVTVNNGDPNGLNVSDPDGDSLNITLSDQVAGNYFSGGVAVEWTTVDSGHTLIGFLSGTDPTDPANQVITVTVQNDGDYTVTLLQPFDDPNTSIEDSISFVVPVTVNDGAESVNTQITVTVEDDSPRIVSVTANQNTVEVDESGPAGSASVALGGHTAGNDGDVAGAGPIGTGTSNVAGLVDANIVFGADGPGSGPTYSLVVTDTDSGLTTTEGDPIHLELTAAGTIVGIVDGGTHDGEVAFAIGIDSATGQVTMDQYLSLDHPDDTDPNDPVHLADGSVGLVVSATDGDGDSVNNSGNPVDVSGQLTFLDDAPSANDDSDTAVGGTAGGNVISGDGTFEGIGNADHPGADGFGGVVQVEGVTTDSDGSNGFSVQGLFGTLTMDTDGNYTYTRTDGLGGGQDDVFTYTYIDGDGDPVEAQLTIHIPDSRPVAGTADAKVDDDGLSGGNPGSTTGDLDADAGESGAGVGDESVWTGTLGGVVGDGTNKFFFEASLDGDTATVGQETVTYHVSADGHLLTAEITSSPDNSRLNDTLFTVEITDQATGDYTLTLEENVLHDPTANGGDNTENDATLSIPYQISDADTDLSLLPGSLNITFDDDMPSASASLNAQGTVTVDESGPPAAATIGLGGNTAGNDEDISGSGPIARSVSGQAVISANIVYGADGAAANQPVYGLSVTNSDSGLTTTEGEDITLVQLNATTILGIVESGGEHSEDVAFAIKIGADGKITVEQYLSLDHPVNPDPNDSLQLDPSTIAATVSATDADGDTVTSAPVDISGQITFLDDGPTLGAFTDANIDNAVGHVDGTYVFDWGADGFGGMTVTGPEIEGITYTSETASDGTVTLTGSAGTTEVFNLVVHPDGTYTFNLVTPDAGSVHTQTLLNIASGQNEWIQTPDGLIEFTPLDHEGNDTGTVNSSGAGFGNQNQFTGNGEAVTFEFHSQNDAGDTAPGTHPEFVSEVTLDVPSNGFNGTTELITWYATNTETGETATGTILVDTNTEQLVFDPGFDFNVLTIEGSAADGNGIRMTQITTITRILPQDQDLDFTIQATDGDGDPTTTSTLSVHINADETLVATADVQTDSLSASMDTSSLMASNDNGGHQQQQHSMETHRAFAVGQNAALMAALAAVGLEADHRGIDWHAVAKLPAESSDLAPLHTASLASVSVEASDSADSSHVAEPVMVSDAVEAPQGGGHFHETVQQAQNAIHAGVHQPAATELLQGSEAPAHGPAAHSSAVTAAAVAMPSAQQLAAAAAHAVGDKPAVGEAVQHNEVVAKVLADSLNGGDGHGPNIDALLAAHGGHANAPDLIEALASHGAGGVPYGHSGGSSAIAMAHSMFSMAMMHHDAAPPAHG